MRGLEEGIVPSIEFSPYYKGFDIYTLKYIYCNIPTSSILLNYIGSTSNRKYIIYHFISTDLYVRSCVIRAKA